MLELLTNRLQMLNRMVKPYLGAFSAIQVLENYMNLS